jgi:hypothetical protein
MIRLASWLAPSPRAIIAVMDTIANRLTAKHLAKVVSGICGDCEAERKKHEKHSVCKFELEGDRPIDAESNR